MAKGVLQSLSWETGMDIGQAGGFIEDFTNASSQDAYLEDTGHQAVNAQLVEAAVGGVDGDIGLESGIA